MFALVLFIVTAFVALSVVSKNKYKYLVAMYCITFVIALFFANLYIYNVTSFRFLTFHSSRIFYDIFSHLSLHVSDIARGYNLCFAMFMTVSLFIGLNLMEIKTIKGIYLILPIIFFIYTTDTSTTRNIFLLENTKPLYNGIGKIIIGIDTCILYLYSLAPIVASLVCLHRTKIFIKRRQYISVFAITLLVTGCFFAIFVYGTYHYVLFSAVSVAGIPNVDSIATYSPSGYIIIVIMLSIFGIIVCLNPFKYHDYISDRATRKSTRELNKNLSMFLHTYKNTFWCIASQLGIIREKLEKNDIQKALEYTDKLERLSRENFSNIASILLIINNKRISFKPVLLEACIDEAISRVTLSDDIKLIKNLSPIKDVYIIGSRQHLVETFVNIITNSADALKCSDTAEKTIRIDSITERDVCMISFFDNGTGIDQKNLNKIFDLFYTTKSLSTNSGIGLNYVRNSVAMHKGDMRIKSRINEYTRVEIAFPIKTNR